MPEVGLQGAGIGALVGQDEATGMAEHVGVNREWQLGLYASAFNQLGQARGGERRTPLTDEDERRLGLSLERPQRPQLVSE